MPNTSFPVLSGGIQGGIVQHLEADILFDQGFNDLVEMGGRPGETVQFRDDQHVAFAHVV